MATINLLPWREEFRAEKKKEFFVIFGATVLFALLLLFLWSLYQNNLIENQMERNSLLKREIAVLNKQVKEIKDLKARRSEMIRKIEVIQGLQLNRPETVKIFDELVRAVPDGLYLSSLSRKNKVISLSGVAESNNRVSAFMRQLDSSYKFTNANLKSVKADGRLGEDGSKFNMRVRVVPAAKQLEEFEDEE